MPYLSILVHAGESASAQARYRLAAGIARAEGAQVRGIALSGATECLYRCGAAGALAPVELDDFSFLTDNAARELALFEDTMRSELVALAPGQVSDDTAAGGLPMAARFCDLLVIGQTCSPVALIADRHTLARSVLLHAPCPVLVVPAGAQTAGVPQRPLLAWDGSMEASRAIRAALPLLRRAASVTAVSFAPLKFAADGADSSQRLLDYLACHGVNVELLTPAHADDVGRALLALAEARTHDLIVMGSFGHTRLREIVLGGATETVLTGAPVPVLMAH